MSPSGPGDLCDGKCRIISVISTVVIGIFNLDRSKSQISFVVAVMVCTQTVIKFLVKFTKNLIHGPGAVGWGTIGLHKKRHRDKGTWFQVIN